MVTDTGESFFELHVASHINCSAHLYFANCISPLINIDIVVINLTNDHNDEDKIRVLINYKLLTVKQQRYLRYIKRYKLRALKQCYCITRDRPIMNPAFYMESMYTDYM